MINVNGVSKYFGNVCAVNDVSFSIRDGEITGLLGPNGAGKTTTMRMLSCYFKPEKGSIDIRDFDVNENSLEIKKLIGYLPESAPLYGDMLVYDFLAYIAEIRGVDDKKRIKEMADLCGINEVMHKSISELSKGYKQRVGLAYAMIHDPGILILDEPTSGLDPNQIVEIRNLIKEIGKKKTVILSTHILSEVEATCDRIIIIDKGSIVADDSKENLQASLKNETNISIKIKGADFENLSMEIKKLNGISSVKERLDADFTSATVSYSNSIDLRPHVFKLIKESDWVLYEMKQEHLSLENVFKELTAGGNDE